MARSRWRLVGGVVLVCIVGALAIWTVQERRAGEISIGVILPLTGEGAKYGVSARQGIDLAFSEVNSSGGIGGKKVRAIYEDSQGSAQQGVSALQKLITLDHVPAVIGDLASSVTLAMAPVAERNHVVIFSPASSAPQLTEAGDYIFRNCASDVFEGQIMAQAARTRLGISKVAILYVNNDYGTGIAGVFRKDFTENGGTILTEEAFLQGAPDFRAQLTKIAGLRPQAIYLVGYKELGQILKQAAELGIKTQFLSTVMFEDPDTLTVAGPAAEGVIYSARAYDAASNDPVVKSFVQAFKTRYGVTPNILAALSFDAARILVKAIELGGPSSDEIKNALYSIQNYHGVCGLTSFDKNGDVTQPAYLKTVRDGKFTWLDKAPGGE